MKATDRVHNTELSSWRGFLAALALAPTLTVPAATFAMAHEDEALISLARQARVEAERGDLRAFYAINEIVRDAMRIAARSHDGIEPKRAIAHVRSDLGNGMFATLDEALQERLLASAAADLKRMAS